VETTGAGYAFNGALEHSAMPDINTLGGIL